MQFLCYSLLEVLELFLTPPNELWVDSVLL